jgi:hypothetical protein
MKPISEELIRVAAENILTSEQKANEQQETPELRAGVAG